MATTKIQPQDIDLAALITALNQQNPGVVASQPSGDFKRVTGLKYNPTTGELLIEYDA